MVKFEGVPVYCLSISILQKGAAVTLPGIGIIVGKGWEDNIDLLRHEFGHILQQRKWGFFVFYRYVAIDSIRSAYKALKGKYNHKSTWTEWSANRLSYNYFNKPDDWNHSDFPINPVSEVALPGSFKKQIEIS